MGGDAVTGRDALEALRRTVAGLRDAAAGIGPGGDVAGTESSPEDTDLRCPLCRAPLDGIEPSVCKSCPLYGLSGGCHLGLLACPRCGYHSLPGEQAAPRHARRDGDAAAVSFHPDTGPDPSGGSVCTMGDLRPGDQARVVGLERLGGPDLRRLLAYGLIPGTDLEVLQRYPAFIVRLFQTEIALARPLARTIRVVPTSRDSPRRSDLNDA